MVRRVRDILVQRAAEGFVGRRDELAVLLQSLEHDSQPVFFVHGVGGIGKSSLLERFLQQARRAGATTVRLDCRAIEPTERGFVRELNAAVGGEAISVEQVANRLGSLSESVVLALDGFEVFRLLDTWLRQEFAPALSDNVRLVLCGREPPVAAWRVSPGWQGLVCPVALGPLSERDAVDLLLDSGVEEAATRRITRMAHGHPLALKLAASAVAEQHGAVLEDAGLQQVLEELTRMYLADVEDPLTRRALEAASVVRRTTVSLLGAMLPDAAPQDSYERLRGLPFVESVRDGLQLHEVVQQAIAASLRAANPNAYRDYRRAAWHQLRIEVRTAGTAELWRYTADMLYMIENPVVREAFFPNDVPIYAVEPARPEDGSEILAMVTRHGGPDAARLLEVWWRAMPETFRVVRETPGSVAGFNCLIDPQRVDAGALRSDPFTAAWCRHLRDNPIPKGQRALFYRCWMTAKHGQELSPVQAACWLDIKRAYMELRPALRRLYATTWDPPPLGPIDRQLGFRSIPGPSLELDGKAHYTEMLDFGPASVDGWLAGLVAAELGVEQGGILDIDARELVLDGRRVGLTKLEFGVMHCLSQREGKAVARASLLQDVWGYDKGSDSNVVDTVVRSLRRKLGDRQVAIESVHGIGYRFRQG